MRVSVFTLSVIIALAISAKSSIVHAASKVAANTVLDSNFDAKAARENLVFAKQQMLKMISLVNTSSQIITGPECAAAETICFPHIVEDEKLKLRAAESWVSGFSSGILWKLLNAEPFYNEPYATEDKQTLFETAMTWTQALSSQAKNRTHHDLGFVLFDSFGEALLYPELTQNDRDSFEAILQQGRESLASRFRAQHNTIRSWDTFPKFRTQYLEDGDVKVGVFDTANPWQYPVIVDNMMNLELLLTSSDQAHHKMAFQHADATQKNHYHYAIDDAQRARPIAFHVIDYDTQKPGNWQGLGHYSAWSRGQAWSFYGFVSMVEFDEKYRAFLNKLNNSVAHFLKDDPIPDWDFFADRKDAYACASNQSNDTTQYHRLLHLCDYELQQHILPYQGFAPIQFDASLLAPATLSFLSKVRTVDNEPFVVKDKVVPCGTTPFNVDGRRIPKDTSAAAILAAAYYRWAENIEEPAQRQQVIAQGDRIMAALTQRFRTDVNKQKGYELGFLLDEAVGNMPYPREVDTPLIYGDFYFVEANIRKLALESGG